MTRPVLEPTPGSDSSRPCVRERAELVDGKGADRVGGAAERLFLVAAGAAALEQRRDAIECLDGIHHPEGTPSVPA